jgi:hypothetical protein
MYLKDILRKVARNLIFIRNQYETESPDTLTEVTNKPIEDLLARDYVLTHVNLLM